THSMLDMRGKKGGLPYCILIPASFPRLRLYWTCLDGALCDAAAPLPGDVLVEGQRKHSSLMNCAVMPVFPNPRRGICEDSTPSVFVVDFNSTKLYICSERGRL